MLQKMRDQTQSVFFKIVVFAIILTLALFGFGAANFFLQTDPAVASVNGDDILQNTLLQESERERMRLASRMGENFDPNTIDPVMLQTRVLDQLIGRMLLGQAATELGIGTSQQQIEDSIRSNPNFQIDGVYEQNTYRRVAQMMGYTPAMFQEVTSELLALQQLQDGVAGSGFLTDWELRQQARLLNQKRDIGFLPFTVEHFSQEVEVSEEDIGLRYQENERSFMTEETVNVEYVELSVAALMADGAIEVTESDVLAAYESERAEFASEEKRDARHILLEVTEERDAQAAQALAGELAQRIRDGESFAELAVEYSDDPGSAAQGGELGTVGKGVFVPEFERVLWELSEGDLSEPVRTEFGVHLISLNAIVVEEYPEFTQVQADIETRLRREQAQELFGEKVRELDSLAFEQPDTLGGIRDGLGLEVRTAENISRASGTGIFGNFTLREALFEPDVLEKGYNSPAVEYLADERAVVARVLERFEPVVKPLEEVAEEIRAELVTEAARSEVQSAQASALARVTAGESVAEVADDYGLEWQTLELARRNQSGVPREVLVVAFELQRPGTAEEKSVGDADGANGTRYVVTVTRVEDGDLSTMAESEIASVRSMLQNRTSSVDFEGFYNSLEADASIDRPVVLAEGS